jgi:CRISPR-associated protein Cas1
VIKKTVEIATAGTKLSIAHRQLVIERPGEEERTLPCEDIGVLVVDHPQVSYTHSVLTALLESGAAIVLCGGNHLPAGLLLPLDAHTTQLHYTEGDAGLSEMARRVRSGDPDNLEALAAQRYWPRLFGPAFRRFRDGPPPNNLLNYGYAVVRAAIARALAAAGLIPTLGVHHRNRGNPFCLADDLLEPYRPYVDWRVRQVISASAAPQDLDKTTKAALLSLFNETVVIGERRLPLLLAFHASATSLCRMLTERGKALALPEGLPVGPDSEQPREGLGE